MTRFTRIAAVATIGLSLALAAGGAFAAEGHSASGQHPGSTAANAPGGCAMGQHAMGRMGQHAMGQHAMGGMRNMNMHGAGPAGTATPPAAAPGNGGSHNH